MAKMQTHATAEAWARLQKCGRTRPARFGHDRENARERVQGGLGTIAKMRTNASGRVWARLQKCGRTRPPRLGHDRKNADACVRQRPGHLIYKTAAPSSNCSALLTKAIKNNDPVVEISSNNGRLLQRCKDSAQVIFAAPTNDLNTF